MLWLYTRATFMLATTAEEQMKFLKAQFVDTKVGELIRSKPIVVTDRNANGETLMSNVGDAFATNVWYLADGNLLPVPLGSLADGQTRAIPIDAADRHVLIAEARQMPPGTARKFTPTLNVWTGHAFAHGFIRRSKVALEHRGSLADYLKQSPDLLEKLAAYDPLSHDPDHETALPAEGVWELWKNGCLAECELSEHPLGFEIGCYIRGNLFFNPGSASEVAVAEAWPS